MGDLPMLPEDVREALYVFEHYECDYPDTNRLDLVLRDYCLRLARENAILEAKNRGTLANNLCPDHRDKQTGKSCLACTIETLTRQKERAESERDALRYAADTYMAAVAAYNTNPWDRVNIRQYDAAKTKLRALVPLDDAEAKG